MKEQFVTYEIALALKELGFDEPCFGAYFKRDSGEVIFEPEPDKFPMNNYTHYLSGIRNSIHCKRDSFADFDKITAPLWQQAWLYILKRLEYKYPLVKLQLFYDSSGVILYHLNMELLDFNDFEEGLLKAIELCKKL